MNATTPPVDKLRSAAPEFLEKADGDVLKAASAMCSKAMSDPDFLRGHYERALYVASYEAVANVVRRDRAQIWALTPEDIARRRTQVEALASATAKSLLDFPLPGGKRLAEATREEVSVASEFYGAQARDMGRKSVWLRLVAQSLPDGAKVGDALTASRLEELRAEASHD